MAVKPEIIEGVLSDLREGLGDIPVMEKYQISPDTLLNIKFSQRKALNQAVRYDQKDRRRARRNYLLFKIKVYEVGNQNNFGIINDLSSGGAQILGVDATPGSIKMFAVQSDSAGVYHTFVFTGTCQWVEETEEGTVTGYCISVPRGEDSNQIGKLISNLTLTQ